jgi:hypothetical protein
MPIPFGVPDRQILVCESCEIKRVECAFRQAARPVAPTIRDLLMKLIEEFTKLHRLMTIMNSTDSLPALNRQRSKHDGGAAMRIIVAAPFAVRLRYRRRPLQMSQRQGAQ